MTTILNNLMAGGDIGPDYDMNVMTDAEIAEQEYHDYVNALREKRDRAWQKFDEAMRRGEDAELDMDYVEAEVELAELGEPITEDDTDGCRWFSDGNLFCDYDDTQDDRRKEKDENYGHVEKDELPF